MATALGSASTSARMMATALSSSAAISAGEKCSVMRLHHLVGAQPFDVLGGESELAQDLVGVLADIGSGRAHGGRRARERDGRALQAHLTEGVVLDRHGEAEVLHLLVLEGLLGVEDGPARHPLDAPPLDAFRAGLADA